MSEEQNFKNLPFDAEGGAGLYGHKPRAMHVSPPRYLTTRSSLFLAFAVMGLDLAFLGGAMVYISVLEAVIITLIWCFTFRYLKKPELSPVATAALTLLAAGAGYVLNDVMTAPWVLVFSLGLVSLGRIPPEEGDDQRVKIYGEVMVPLFFAILASLAGYYGAMVFERRYLFIEIIVSVSFLILASIIISKISGSRFFFTSRRLTEFWDIPVAEFSQTRIFLFAKLKFLITSVWIFVIAVAIWYFVDTPWRDHLFIPVIAVLVLPVVFLIAASDRDVKSAFGPKFHLYEAYICAALTGLFFIQYSRELSLARAVYIFLLFAGTDIIGSALLAVIRRRQIFVSRSKYIDGTPFMMTMFALLVMLLESVS
ncbi:MAG: hypothetical protein IKH76_11055 [Clostridiales bacterium]|nr:hypothetical protein [Clostridiales bacterium]